MPYDLWQEEMARFEARLRGAGDRDNGGGSGGGEDCCDYDLEEVIQMCDEMYDALGDALDYLRDALGYED